MRIALFITCYNDTLFPHTGQAVVRVLERLGHTVEFPLEQTCCGQMHFNTGYRREAYPMAKRFIQAISDASPGIEPKAFFWRYVFMIGSVVYTVADLGVLDRTAQLSGGKVQARKAADLQEARLDFLIAGMRPDPENTTTLRLSEAGALAGR